MKGFFLIPFFFFASCLAVGQYQYDMTVVEPCQFTYATPGTYVLKAAIQTLGSAAITAVELNWQLDNGPVETSWISDFEVYTIMGAPGGIDRVVSPIPINFPAVGVYDVKVWISRVNGGFSDQNPSNDVVTKQVKVLSYVPPKSILVDYYTHTTCGPCGQHGGPQIQAIEDQFPGIAHGISIHAAASDPYSTTTTQLLNDDMVVTAHPRIYVDRFKMPFLAQMDPLNSYDNLIKYRIAQDRLEYTEPVEVEVVNVNYNPATRIVSGDVKATFFDDITGDHAFAVYLAEDSILGYQAGAQDPNNYWHRNVFRAAVGPALGLSGSIPNTVSTGQVLTHAFSYVVGSSWNEERMFIYGMVVQQHPTDIHQRRVLNMSRVNVLDAASVGIYEASADPFRLWPTYASEFVQVDLGSPMAAGATLELYSAEGKLVSLYPGYAGQQVFAIRVTNLVAGMYSVKFRNGNDFAQGRFIKQ